ncbi:unnamed protein product [Symbiodinium sp. CCMP2456]|nr:unnamed protein product [Symbiodinium sp. CCMP2456]
MTVDAAAAFVLPLPNLEARRADALTAGARAAAHSFQHPRYQPLQAYSVGCTSGLALSSLGLAASARQTRRRTRLARPAASRSFAPPRTTRPDDGRHWETSVFHIGPASTEPKKLRVVGYEASGIQALSLSDETLFVGAAGRVRAMDVSSGGHAGEFAEGSHMPHETKELWSGFADGQRLVVAGRSDGKLVGWRCGVTTETLAFNCHSQQGQPITGLVETEGLLASSTADGTIHFWNVADIANDTINLERAETTCGKPVLCLASGQGAIYAGCEDGSVLRISGGSDPEEVFKSDGPVTALACGPASGSLILGHVDGRMVQTLEDGTSLEMAAFHTDQVRFLQNLSTGVLSIAADGRLGFWEEDEGSIQPQWGFRGLPARTIAAADDTQIFLTCSINSHTPGNRVLDSSWKRSGTDFDEVAPACEAILQVSL